MTLALEQLIKLGPESSFVEGSLMRKIWRPNEDFELGLTGRLLSYLCFFLAVAFCCLGIALFVYLVELIPRTGPIRIPKIVAEIFIIPFALGAWRLWRLGKRLGTGSAAAVLRSDNRPPVLYLRSFDSDEDEDPRSTRQRFWGAWMQTSVEERDVRSLKRIGPVIAVTKPGAWLPPIGAVRVTFSDADWKNGVTKLIQDCQLIVIKIGTTANLFWELHQAFDVHPFKRVLICMPRAGQGSITNTQQRYERFKRALELELPRTASMLPQELGAAGYFLFDRPGRVIEFNGLKDTFPLELLEYLCPGTLESMSAEAKRARKVAVIGGIAVMFGIWGSIILILYIFD